MGSATAPSAAGAVVKGFKGVENIPITKEEMEEEYCKVTGWRYPIMEIVFVRSWMVMRVSDRDVEFLTNRADSGLVGYHRSRCCCSVCQATSQF